MNNCKFGGEWKSWYTREISGVHRMGVWKHIRRGGIFTRHTRPVLGDGFIIKFWSDLWCGTNALKDSFPFVFRLTCEKEGSVANLMERSGDQIYWNIIFSRAAQD